MAKKAKNSKSIEQYEHIGEERLNNPPVGLVDSHTDNGGYKKQTYQYDPHFDPQLQWSGKAERLSFDVPTVSLHVHERIDPRRIIESVLVEDKSDAWQPSLFETGKKPLREAIEFYKHRENWSNRLIAGDSLLVMNSLLEKEGMSGKVQMIYFDPPYGIKYGSNFQPFINKREVKDGKDEDLTVEPEMLKAFRDTWELGIHSYLTYLRDRLLLAKDLLSDSGSVFVQISDENVHHVREILDEVFLPENCIGQIIFKKTGAMSGNFISGIFDTLLWYSKDKTKAKFRRILVPRTKESIDSGFSYIEFKDKSWRRLTKDELNDNLPIPEGRRFQTSPVMSGGESKEGLIPLEYNGKTYYPSSGNHWKISVDDLKIVGNKGRLFPVGNTMTFKKYLDEAPYTSLKNVWLDTMESTYAVQRMYVVQTAEKVIQRCILMTTDPGDLVFDPTCGSGTTAKVSEEYGRRWITCDTSRISLNIAKIRLMSANFMYFNLAHPNEGVGSGFLYDTIPIITLKSVAIGDNIPQENLIDRPKINTSLCRVTGPFTIEAVPAPVAKSFNELAPENMLDADNSISRSGETLRQDEWRNELLRTGVRAKGGKMIEFIRVEPLSGTRFLQAEAETKVVMPHENLFDKKQPTLMEQPKRVVVCFGPEHAPLEQRMVELALEEARNLRPLPEIVLFCAFHFDPEARKDIEETNWPGITLLEAQMNADLLTDDLKKKRSSNESFWLIGQPDVTLKELKSGEDKGKYLIEVNGFDYYNPKTGTVDSGGKSDIAMWMLDHNYDGRSLFPSQVFFPMAGSKEGWATLAKNLKAEIDEEKIEAFGGTVSLPFIPGQEIAVKIIDARGIESLKIIRL